MPMLLSWASVCDLVCDLWITVTGLTWLLPCRTSTLGKLRLGKGECRKWV